MNRRQAARLLERQEVGTYLITSLPDTADRQWVASVHQKIDNNTWRKLPYPPSDPNTLRDNYTLASIMAKSMDPYDMEFIWSLS